MIKLTGFEPLDIIIMESLRKTEKTKEYMKEYNLELSDALEELGYDLEDFTGNDLQELISFRQY